MSPQEEKEVVRKLYRRACLDRIVASQEIIVAEANSQEGILAHLKFSIALSSLLLLDVFLESRGEWEWMVEFRNENWHPQHDGDKEAFTILKHIEETVKGFIQEPSVAAWRVHDTAKVLELPPPGRTSQSEGQ